MSASPVGRSTLLRCVGNLMELFKRCQALRGSFVSVFVPFVWFVLVF
jgi:hypothetical protein